MIKKSVFEDEIIANMERELVEGDKLQAINNFDKAIDSLHAAVEIFESHGLYSQADKVLNIMKRFSQSQVTHDKATHNLTPEKMVANLKNHGTEFNMTDDHQIDDLLNLDIEEPIEVEDVKDKDADEDFENE